MGYLLLPKSTRAGSAVSSYLDTRCRFYQDNSSLRTAGEHIESMLNEQARWPVVPRGLNSVC
eukprot:619786-Pyramimonas_sp.AAC.1